MIKYYNTEAEYNAAAKSAFESQISLIGENNNVRFDGVNVVVGAKSAKTGSIAVLDGNSALHFISLKTFSTGSFFSNFTGVGVVAIGVDHPDFKGKLCIAAKNSDSFVWSYIYSFRLTGYTLDGTDRTGTLNVRKPGSWGTGDDYVIPYNASTVEELAQQLNAYFQENEPFIAQDWVAQVTADGAIDLVMHYVDYRQASNTGKAGFTIAGNLLPEVIASASMLRRNGYRSGSGAVLNMPRAIAYFRADNSSTTYNPNADVTTTKRAYPVCLPGYLGTSQYQSDHCAALRAAYGEGEAGWLKQMEDFKAVLSDNGVFDSRRFDDGKADSYAMAGRTFIGQNGAAHACHPAADYATRLSFNHNLLRKGCWHLPSIKVLASIMKTIVYSVGGRNDDPVNAALNAIGGTAISNYAGFWSSSRFVADYAWCFLGSAGCALSSGLYSGYRALPVLLLSLDELEEGIEA